MSAIFTLLVIVGFTGCDGIPADKSSGVDTGQGDMDKLFRDMGIIKVPHAGEPVDFSLKDLTERVVRVSYFRGKIVLLAFWTTWCPPCREEMASIERLHRRLKERDFVIVAVNLQESASRVRRSSRITI
ncbi:MAG: TlpA disulfide reductase family protein [Pseudomonadota bacterium]